MDRETLKPFAGGLVVGADALAIIAFSAGWVVTSGSSEREKRAAWIDGQASICASLAMAHRKAIGDMTDLSSYQARAARDELAKASAVVLPGEEAADAAVVSACSDLLRTSGT